jgi:hypothetical protein
MKTKRTGPLFDMRSGSKFYIKLRYSANINIQDSVHKVD